jgi:hypothetical protein
MGRYLDLLRDPADSESVGWRHRDKSDISDQSYAKVDIDAETRAPIGVKSLSSLSSLLSQPSPANTQSAASNRDTPEASIQPVEDWSEAEEKRAARTDTTVIAPVQWFEGAAAPDEPPYDKPSPARRGLIRRPGGRFEHFCAICGAWGAFGLDVTAEEPGRWYCLRHRASGIEPQ